MWISGLLFFNKNTSKNFISNFRIRNFNVVVKGRMKFFFFWWIPNIFFIWNFDTSMLLYFNYSDNLISSCLCYIGHTSIHDDSIRIHRRFLCFNFWKQKQYYIDIETHNFWSFHINGYETWNTYHSWIFTYKYIWWLSLLSVERERVKEWWKKMNKHFIFCWNKIQNSKCIKKLKLIENYPSLERRILYIFFVLSLKFVKKKKF